MMKQKLGQ